MASARLLLLSDRHHREHGGGETGESRQQAQLNLGTELSTLMQMQSRIVLCEIVSETLSK